MCFLNLARILCVFCYTARFSFFQLRENEKATRTGKYFLVTKHTHDFCVCSTNNVDHTRRNPINVLKSSAHPRTSNFYFIFFNAWRKNVYIHGIYDIHVRFYTPTKHTFILKCTHVKYIYIRIYTHIQLRDAAVALAI